MQFSEAGAVQIFDLGMVWQMRIFDRRNAIVMRNQRAMLDFWVRGMGGDRLPLARFLLEYYCRPKLGCAPVSAAALEASLAVLYTDPQTGAAL